MSGSVRQTFIVTVESGDYLTPTLVQRAIAEGAVFAGFDCNEVKATWVADRKEESR